MPPTVISIITFLLVFSIPTLLPIVIGIASIAIGLLLGGIAFKEILDRRSLRRHGRRTGGVVAHYSCINAQFHAVFRFDDTQGRTHHFTHSASGVTEFPIGRPVPVLYDPENPSRVQLDMRMKVWGAVLFFMLVCLVFFSGGVVVLVLVVGGLIR
ncbi:DUF3592 domain-containing protein [Actinomadura sp. LOL_016]|uniref:DUF3592 domain-containing protein n=1 Tax=unclassified Actinomadura TaxID=2626254 RepID=UPI003A7F95C1